jgi:sulfate adenylyltransferase
MAYVGDKDKYLPENEVPAGARALNISGHRIASVGWFTYSAQELRRSVPSRHKQGATIFFRGLSKAGKSTIAHVLFIKLLEMGGRPVTLLDGDLARKHLSSELGFSSEHRDINLRRIGYVASEITENRGIAICAPIAPYDATRKEVRAMIEPFGGFVMVYLSTPVDVCERRDRKGLYVKGCAGILKDFAGVSDPYEEPNDAQVVINTAEVTLEEAAQAMNVTHGARKIYRG